MIAVVPVPAPVTIPVEAPTEAIAGEPLVHEPPPPSVSAVVAPMHTLSIPAIAAGKGFTVKGVVRAQPVDNE